MLSHALAAGKNSTKDKLANTVTSSQDLTNLFDQLNTNQQQLAGLKKNLVNFIDSFTKRSSLFARAAAFWGRLSWWQQGLTGVVLTAPLLATAIITHLAVLLAVSICLLAIAIIGSFLLSNHHKHSQANKENLTQGLLSLANILDAVISSLAALGEQLTLEVEKFQQENKTLALLVKKLGKEVSELTVQTTKLATIEEKLKLTESELAKTVAEVSVKTQQQADLIAHYTQQLQEITEDADLKQTQLADQITALNVIKDKLASELTIAHQVGDILHGTVKTLVESSIQNSEQQENFQARLNDFLTNRELTLAHLATSIVDAEQKLRLLTEALACSNQRYETLLNQQEVQVERLEKVADTKTMGLKRLGLFAGLPRREFDPVTPLKSWTNLIIPS